MSSCEQFQITIKNDTVAGQQVQERIVKILEDLGYPPRDVFSVRLALEEALVNAIKHGNGMDPAKLVRAKHGKKKVTAQYVLNSIRLAMEEVIRPECAALADPRSSTKTQTSTRFPLRLGWAGGMIMPRGDGGKSRNNPSAAVPPSP